MPAEHDPAREAHPLDRVVCPNCQHVIEATVPACPYCGRKADVEHPADIQPTRHAPNSGVDDTNLRS